MEQLLTLGDVSKLLGIPTYTIQYWLNSQKVAEPSRIAGRRVWTKEQIKELSARLATEGKRGKK